jgi:hypothetical protein
MLGMLVGSVLNWTSHSRVSDKVENGDAITGERVASAETSEKIRTFATD